MADPTPQQLAEALTLNERMSEWATMLDPNYRRVRPGMKFDEYQKQVAEGLGVTGWLTQGPPQSEFSRPADLPSGMFERDAAKLGRGARGLFNSAIDGLAKAGLSFGFVNNGGVLTDNEITDTALNTLGGGSTFSKAIGAKAVGGPGGKVLGANVYQGGPHKYGPEGAAQSLQHMSKGEGAQAYGWGRYDAGNRAVGEQYRRDLSGFDELTLYTKGGQKRGEALDNIDMNVAKYLEIGAGDAGQFKHNTVYYAKKRAEGAGDKEAIARLDEYGPDVRAGYEKNTGYLYKHDLPDEDIARYLDWDKPLSEQPGNVQAAAGKMGLTGPVSEWRDGMSLGGGSTLRIQVDPDLPEYKKYFMEVGGSSFRLSDADVARVAGRPGETLTGQQIISRLTEMHGGDQAASEALRKVGIPGLRYLDGGSRNAGAGSHNYVTWDQDVLNRMKLLERNGETFGMTGNPAMLAAGQNQDRPGPSKMALELAKRLRDQEFYAKGGI